MFKINSMSPEQTRQIGELTAHCLGRDAVICLEGDLGAGKTLFTQGFCRALGTIEQATSPTFNLMNVYEGAKRIYHFDLYRLEDEEDLYEIGFYEYSDVEGENAVALIEWPDRFWQCMPEDYLHILIERSGGQSQRTVTISLSGSRYKDLYEKLQKALRKN